MVNIHKNCPRRPSSTVSACEICSESWPNFELKLFLLCQILQSILVKRKKLNTSRRVPRIQGYPTKTHDCGYMLLSCAKIYFSVKSRPVLVQHKVPAYVCTVCMGKRDWKTSTNIREENICFVSEREKMPNNNKNHTTKVWKVYKRSSSLKVDIYTYFNSFIFFCCCCRSVQHSPALDCWVFFSVLVRGVPVHALCSLVEEK